MRKIFKWLSISVCTLAAVFLLQHMTFNYLGYCTHNLEKVDENLLIDELIYGVANGGRPSILYRNVPKTGDEFHYTFDAGRNSPGAFKIDPRTIVPYRDSAQLRELNPDCCSFTSTGLYGEVNWEPSLLERLFFGFGKGYANVKYLVRYREIDGAIKTGWQAHSVRYDNCGRVNNPVLN
jgi:hypothetical protein